MNTSALSGTQNKKQKIYFHLSYSLYLTHNIVVGSVFFLGFKFLPANLFTEITYLSVAVIASLCFAVIICQRPPTLSRGLPA
ncbi:MAG: hypothetical protein SWZ49_20030 [Cyanobacteriota bacterium]|nr:hypothetical protein [Cyanobacteriota bacterium]